MADGWIKLHRSMLDWEWYKDQSCFRLFTHLLISANYEPSRFQGEVIPAGGTVTGLHSLSEKTGLSISQLRTALDKLSRTNEIAIKATNKFSIITITNWLEYQTDDNQIANQSQTDSKPIATSKEGKNKRKKEYINIGIPDWMPKKEWEDFLAMRIGMGKRATEEAQRLLVLKLDDLRGKGFSPELVLKESTMRNWSGVFELKSSKQSAPQQGFAKQDYKAGTEGFLGDDDSW